MRSERKLSNAGRVLTKPDPGDFVAGHVTVRLPDDPHRFLMKPATIGLDEMTLDNIITVDLDGQKVGGTMPRHNEVFIHSEVLRARPDIQCVIHTHAPHAVAFSSLGRELVPVNNEAGYFYKSLPVFSETTDLIVSPEHRQGCGALPRAERRGAPAQPRHRHGRPQHRGGGVDHAQARGPGPAASSSWRNGPGVRSLLPKARTSSRRTPRGMRPDLYTNVFNYLVALLVPRCTARPTTPAAPSTTRRI